MAEDKAPELSFAGVEVELVSSEQFERLLGMSLSFAEEVMSMELDVDHKHFARVLAIKQSIASSTLTVMARVNGGNLRGAKADGLEELLAQLNGETEDIDPLS